MRSSLLFVSCLSACGAAARPAPPPACPPVAAAAATPAPGTPTPPPRAPELDAAAVTSMSHAFFDAGDRMDAAAYGAVLAPSFVLFEDARFVDAAFLTKSMQARLERHAPVRTRTWSDEHVFPAGDTIVFIGEAVEHIPADGGRPAGEYDGYNTLVWIRDGAQWKIALWQWARAGLEAEKQRWNDVFRAKVGFKTDPNQLLVDAVKGRRPGKALDIAMGQGRNAVFLASQRWKVTGVDISDEGLRIAREDAAKRKLTLETVESDIDKYDLGKDKWDLIAMIYAGNDMKLVERIKPALRKKGIFVTEYFAADSEAAKTGAGGWDEAALKAAFHDGFTILRDDVVEDVADYTMRKMKLVRFVVEKQ